MNNSPNILLRLGSYPKSLSCFLQGKYASVKNSSLSGSTLIEVLTSLSLLSLLFVLAMVLFQRISGVHSPVQQYRTRVYVQEMLHEPLSVLTSTEETREVRGRRLVRTVGLTDDLPYIQITVSCYWGERLLLKRSRIQSLLP